MKIGIIGAGRVAQALARHISAGGDQAILSNSRGPDSLAELVRNFGAGVSAGSIRQAAEASMVALAVPWLKIDEALAGLPHWEGRILVDATNQFVGRDLADLGGRTSSEIVAGLAPGARVVKALNTLVVERFESGPFKAGARRVTFISGDDAEAKAQVGSLLSGFGFAVVDLGSLRIGGLAQQAGGALAGVDLLKAT
ncbi:NADPH-dependent F420 reductase [Beijerinckia sp. L45]|uniref:NADPH-dependent F420 reductase n=1 Tax=Beijerinckia sp. L45 TaxID=1641855 RepID=UPI00131E4BE6|nr:NAD(P)-binding domain-containing protein [Beijerinckia sp. L45]